MKALLITCALAFGGCGALQNAALKIGEAVDFGKELKADMAPLKEKVAQISAAIQSLDKDADGKVSLAEMLAGLAGVLGVFGVRNAMSAKEKKRALEAKVSP